MFDFRLIKDEDVDKIINWKNQNDYSCYDIEKNNVDLDRLLEKKSCEFFVALDEDEELAGFIECSFDEDDDIDMGCALLPDLLGKGLGFDFVSECVEFLIDYYQFSGESLYTILKSEDIHSRRIFERVGFSADDESNEWVKLSIYM
ncbi:GNAT family N-acetyltransferase [Helicovermis profundi]|uniref:N-acetyltransferase domain-containing protein n=1 Tax=Helicovermis profundi TaxID=3065157 RepID=A0AAU9ER57_9FIRM|nr:hypothetical protein HLPR_21870 [Clostridia bacterium S502]